MIRGIDTTGPAARAQKGLLAEPGVIIAIASFLMLALLAFPTHAFEKAIMTIPADNVPTVQAALQTAPVVRDVCRTHLQPAPAPVLRSHAIPDHQAASQAAASLVLGLQYVPGPRQGGHQKNDAGTISAKTLEGDRMARAVTDYRRCRNQQQLEALAR